MHQRISVCMAIKNGEAYLKDQLASILPQLTGDDELIISDDHSTDTSHHIVQQFRDNRIQWHSNPGNGVVNNFENALRKASGTYIFLADQDDVWTSEKVRVMMSHLAQWDLVVSDCELTDKDLAISDRSFFSLNKSGKGLIRNLIRNSYMGCCMAFHRKVLERALPFPDGIPMHDLWIGLVAELHYKVRFIPDKLLLHRRHEGNASTTGGRSQSSWSQRITHRLAVVKNLVEKNYAR